MSDISNFSDEEDSRQDDCALVDALSEINFNENNIESIRQNKLEENQEQKHEIHSDPASSNSLNFVDVDEYDYLHDSEWINQKCHVFILSTAGKPIYNLNGDEEKLNTLFGLLQALVSVVQTDDDCIRSITAKNTKFVFLVKSPLILVGVNKSNRSEQQIYNQLMDVYNQIIFIVTLSHMKSVYEKRNNYDLRKLVAGSERWVDHLLRNEKRTRICNSSFVSLTHSVRILPMESSIRDSITATIQSNCTKIKNLVFAVLLANNKLITLVRMKNYYMHTDDLRLIFNVIDCSESFKSAENWLPICLPKFDSNGALYAHISYISDDCEACLLLMTVDPESFPILSNAKKNITEKLRRGNCMEAINAGIRDKGIKLKTDVAVPEIRHFFYKNKKNTQLLCSEITAPYSNNLDQFERLEAMYYDLHNRIHRTSRPLKLIYEMHQHEIQLAWVTANYELYATFEPLVDKKSVIIAQVNKLLKWIRKEEDKLFMTGTHIF
ncbi:vacuolar fusion protein MON1 homolog [Chironomus tepperi]|uniref:vacuolar fusion protein MON1 homolog n=1 Tax=Chironomus tepperi TaxID=113505 RepID=UPI00391F7B82